MDRINDQIPSGPLQPHEVPGWQELFNELVNVSNEMSLLKQTLGLAMQRLEFYEKDQWINSREAETLLKVSRRTLATMRKKGIISYSNISGKYMYKRSDIMKRAGLR